MRKMFKTATSFILSTAILLATVAATFVFPVNADGAENTSLVNGNFEDGTTGWNITGTGATFKTVSGVQNENHKDVKITGKAGYFETKDINTWLYQGVKLSAGKYTWDFHIDLYGTHNMVGAYTSLDGIGKGSNLIVADEFKATNDAGVVSSSFKKDTNDYRISCGKGNYHYTVSYTFTLSETTDVYFAIRGNGGACQYIDNMKVANQNVVALDDFSNYTTTDGRMTIDNSDGTNGTAALKFERTDNAASSSFAYSNLYKDEAEGVKAVIESGKMYLIRFKYKITVITSSNGYLTIAPISMANQTLRPSYTAGQGASQIRTNATCDWKSAELRFCAKQAWAEADAESLDLGIGFGGSGTAYVDDVEVIRLDKVTYDSNGGSDVSDITYGETGTDIVFPVAPTRDGYTFIGWYVDAECTTKAVKYNGDAVLYAGWVYTANIVALDDFSNYTTTDGRMTIDNSDGTNGTAALKFERTDNAASSSFAYSNLYKDEAAGVKAVIESGKMYLIRFKYKIIEITSSNEYLTIAPISMANQTLRPSYTAGQGASQIRTNATCDWKSAELSFCAKQAWTEADVESLDLGIGFGGSGTAYIDDVEVIRLDKITYDVMGGEELQPIYGEYGTPVTYSYTTKANHVFTGWYKDGTFNEKAADVFSGDTTVYAGWKNVIQGGKHSFSYGADIDGSFITEDGKELKYTNDSAAVSVDSYGNVTIKNNGDEAAKYTFLLNDHNGLYASLAKNSYAVKYGYKASAGTSFAFVTGIGENFAAKCTKNIEVIENMSSNALSELHFTGIGKTTEEGVVYYPYLGIRATIPAGGELVLSGITVKNTYIVKVETWGGEYSGDTTFSVDQGDNFNIGWLTTPTLDGYKFMGWYTNAGYEHITGTITVTADTTIYADWLPMGLEADVNGDGKLDILDLVRAKKVFADENAYSEYDIDRAYYLGKDKGDAANLSGIRKLLLGMADSANTANDIRIAGVSIGKFAFEMPESTEGSILSEGISAFKESLSAFNISETAASGQPVIKAELTESDAPTSSYTFTVTKDGITVSADNAEALIGGLNRLAHMLNLASETKTQLHLNVGYTCPFEFAPLDGEYAISFIDTFNSFDRSVWVDAETPYHRNTKYINGSNNETDAKRYVLNTITAKTNEAGRLMLPAEKIADNNGNTGFYSSGISTKDTMNYKYGVLEVRAKIGATPLCSSIWLKGVEKNSETGHFPEVDVFETNWQSNDGVDNDKKLGFNVHWWDTATVSGNIGAQWSDTKTKFSDDFHTYTFVWTPEAYTVYVDGVEYGNYSITNGSLGANEAETFRQPMFLILASGIADVDYGPMYDETKYKDLFPDYEIDYVKISQRASDGGLMNITRKSDIQVKRTTEQHKKLLKDFGLTIY